MVKPYVNFFLLLNILSCTLEKSPAGQNHKPYFDLVQYFKKEAQRLETREQWVLKKVSKNGISEQKKIQLNSWTHELELFSSSDINKPDWANSYTMDSSVNFLSYRCISPKLKTKNISIYKNADGSIRRIHILNREHNWLYQSTEILDYYTDSCYKINKTQQTLILGENQYVIEGILK